MYHTRKHGSVHQNETSPSGPALLNVENCPRAIAATTRSTDTNFKLAANGSKVFNSALRPGLKKSGYSSDKPTSHVIPEMPSPSNERIAKIKEERRKQLQAKFSESGLKRDFASSEILSSESSFLRRSLRLSKRAQSTTTADNPEVANNEGASSSASESALGLTSRRRFITREQSDVESSASASGIVRSTRASRLRAQAASSLLSTSLTRTGDGAATKAESTKKNLSDGDTKSTQDVDVNDNLTEKGSTQSVPSQVSASENKPAVYDSGSDTRVKDKSSKRKSNLNRANFLEEQRPLLSESVDVTRKPRRSRRTSESSQSSLEKTEGAFFRTGSLRVPETSTRYKKSSSDSLASDKEPETRFGRRSSPVSTKLRDNSPRKASALKKPEIPEVLRHRLNSPTASRTNDVPKISRVKTVEEVERPSQSSARRLSSDTHTPAADNSNDEIFTTPPETLSGRDSSSPGLRRDSYRAQSILSRTVVTSRETSSVSGTVSDEFSVHQNPIFVSKSQDVNVDTLTTASFKSTEVVIARSLDDKVVKAVDEDDVHRPLSILKKKGSSEEKEPLPEEFHPILKRQSFDETHNPQVHSILKNRSSLEDSSPSSPCDPKPILKKRFSQEDIASDSAARDPKPILKKKSLEEEPEDKPKPILKSRRNSEEVIEAGLGLAIPRPKPETTAFRSILKRSEDSFEVETSVQSEIVCSAQISSSSPLKVQRRYSDDIVSDLTLRSTLQSRIVPRRGSADSEYPALKALPRPADKTEVPVPSDEVKAAPLEVNVLNPVLKGGLKVSDGVIPSHRERFNRRNIPRYRTQPVTQVEVEQTDCLESVKAFRALILKKASLNVFEERQHQTGNEEILKPLENVKPEGVKREYPLPYRSERRKRNERKQDRRKNSRYRTLPITLEELNEAEKCEREAAAAAAMSESTKSDTESSDELVKLSVAAKANLFQNKASENAVRKLSGVSAGKNRRSSNRFLTQPITGEEVHEAAKSLETSEPQSPDDPSNLSLMEKLRLFSNQNKKSNPEPLIRVNSTRRSGRRSDSRFRTQPITCEEVFKAMPRSGLAASLSRISDENEDKRLDIASPPVILPPTRTKKAEEVPVQPTVVVKSTQPVVEAQSSPSSESSSSSESESDDDQDEGKTVLTGGKRHIVINQMAPAKTSPVPQRKIENPAVQRRLNAALRQKEQRTLQASQILEAQSKLSSKSKPRRKTINEGSLPSDISTMVLPHSRTQPVLTVQPQETSPGSIKDRLAALQKSGTEDWQKRILQTKPAIADEIKPRANTLPLAETSNSPSAILNLKSKLEESQDQWRHRVEEKDQTKYTVAGKMANSNSSIASPNTTPLLGRKKNVPKALPFVSGQGKQASVAVLPMGILPLTKSKSTPVASRVLSSSESSEDEADSSPSNSNNLRVLVPKADNETFSSFFQSTVTKSNTEEKLEISEESFNDVTSQTHQLLVQKRTVKMQKRHAASRNPLKVLGSRTDIQQEYTQVKTGFAEQEVRRLNIEKLAQSSGKSLSALAGLASTEDFKAVALKKSGPEACPLMAHDSVMLVQVKGRRHVQTRLVRPTMESLNSGDSYVLVTPQQVICYIGQFSNVIERAKVTEVASVIQLKKDAGFKGTEEVVMIDNEKENDPTLEKRLKNCFELLEGQEKEPQPAGLPEEDEVYEKSIIETNMIYSVEGDILVPYKEFWGRLPSIEMLQTDKVYVFDFGSELYVWTGKQVPFEERKNVLRLAKELWDAGYDYTDCDINPLSTKIENDDDSNPKKGSGRPNWAQFYKVNQHMEPVLFREKFLDWPDTTRLIKVKGQNGTEENGKVDPELKAYDAKSMLASLPEEPDLELEGSHLGRCIEYYDEIERRTFEIETISIAVWHILEYDSICLLPVSYGQFHSGDTYVVRWQYKLVQVGRNFQGQASKHSSTGRNRCAYFFWQGKDSSITEKGASALMTVELNNERGPHVRVVQGKESPCFLNLFGGKMIIYMGKREEEETNTPGPWKLFILLGEFKNETMLLETKACAQSLRSLRSLILVNSETGKVYLWHGAKASTQCREVSEEAVQNLANVRPQEMLFNDELKVIEIITLNEGQETSEFWEGIGGKKRKHYFSLLRNPKSFESTPRLYYLSSISGVFTATEVTCTYFTTKHPCFLSFQQSELYSASQPALYLLDTGREVYLWQGWLLQGEDASDNVATGSAAHRWAVDRRCAMETALHYCQEKNGDDPPEAYLIQAGSEPLEFTNLFPIWESDHRVPVTSSKRSKHDPPLVADVLAKLDRQHFTFEELTSFPLPEGVDPSRLESYLSEPDFKNILTMTKEEYYNKPQWKQLELKKQAGLF